jgi:putative transposase
MRLRGYDYSKEGAYYVTMCTLERECVLGKIKDRVMILSRIGEIIKSCWETIPDHFENVELGDYVIMPNHVHGVILLRGVPSRDGVTCGDNLICRGEVTSPLHDPSATEPQRYTPSRRATLGHVVALYKYQSTKMINAIRDAAGTRFWQRNYYEHIIRGAKDLEHIQKYIADNVSNWSEDEENPESAQ